jgi:molybdate transport system substrate-binding protein
MPMTMPVFLLLATLLPAAGDSAARTAPRARGGILVSAAASLGPVFRTLGAAFTAAHPGKAVTFNFAASGVLRAQLEQGAPVDVYASAGEWEMTPLVEKGLVDSSSVRVFATNRLVLCAPIHGRLTHLKQLESDVIRRVAIGNPGTVPAGRLAVQALARAGVWRAVQPKLVYGETVRQVLQYVETSVVDAGVVYLTDAHDNPRVRLVGENDSPWLERVPYPAGVTARAAEPALAREFIDFLRSDKAREILKAAGFGIP